MTTTVANDEKLSSFPELSCFVQDIPSSLKGTILVYGPPGIGKTTYCREFIEDGLRRGEPCIFVSGGLGRDELQALFPDVDGDLLELVDMHTIFSAADAPGQLISILEESIASLKKRRRTLPAAARLVIDSLTHLLILVEERELLRLVMNLTLLVKDIEARAVLTLSTFDENFLAKLGPLVDGAIELKVEESAGAVIRRARMPFFKGIHHSRDWINFEITKDGRLAFSKASASPPTCVLCGKEIAGMPLIESNFIFDRQVCIDTYMKLRSAYGSRISDTGLPAEVLDAHFFFVDIVGLSDPSLSVKKQVQKINILNSMIGSCHSFKKTAAEKKIILPSGDGMAIGFLLDPELPLALSIELHKKIRAFNSTRPLEDRIEVRIGLGSGPIFTVSDINGMQNVWGPGIILARRVMDAGDSYHILLEGNIAEKLIALKDEYRETIRQISCDFEIKHGQKIRLYSACSHEFGNPEIPARASNAN
ncbi:MAG: hypothetical protein HRF40_04090 [Nitrososphaera sp.]|jgi:KaiC/GvpD/RAD55 family RecA-like ATPase